MSAAEQFVTQRNRTLRLQTAEKDSLEHQVTLDEVGIVNGAIAVDETVKKLIDTGDFTDKKIIEERDKVFEAWDKKSRKRVEQAAQRVADFSDNFTLPDLDPNKLSMLAATYGAMSPQERFAWMREARTGQNEEIALFLLHAPRTLTKISDEGFDALANKFRSEKDIIRHERKRDLQARARAVLDAYEAERRRLLT